MCKCEQNNLLKFENKKWKNNRWSDKCKYNKNKKAVYLIIYYIILHRSPGNMFYKSVSLMTWYINTFKVCNLFCFI